MKSLEICMTYVMCPGPHGSGNSTNTFCSLSCVDRLFRFLKTRNSMIIPTTIIAAAAALTAIPSIAAAPNPSLSVVGVILVLVAGVITTDVFTDMVTTGVITANVGGTLHVVVKNGDGSMELCVIVPTDPPGNALNSCAAASFGSARFGDSNRLLQPPIGGIVIFITGELPSRRTVVLVVYKPGALE
jgi:hypothetical protein